MDCRRPGPKPALGVESQKELYDAIVELQKIGHGIGRKEILRLGGEIGSKNKTKVLKNDMPSKRWFRSFKIRHNLSLRHAETLSIARANMIVEGVKDEFLKKRSKVITDLKLSGTDIYNVDESDLTLVNRGGTVTVPKCSKTVFMRNSGDRRENITTVAACSATGTVILPPMIIYKGVRLNGAPEDTTFATSLKGYIDSDIFYTWFLRFVSRIPSRCPNLLLDGHTPHLSGETLLLEE
jgi:hypothetical protein